MQLVAPELAEELILDSGRIEFLDKEAFVDFPHGEVARADLVAKTQICLQSIEQAEINEAQRFALVNVVATYIELSAEQEKRFEETIQKPKNEKIRELQMMTWAQKVAAQGREEGRQEGRREGEKQGKIQATREAIVLFWQNRIGVLSDGIQTKLDAIDDLSRLYEILERLSEAQPDPAVLRRLVEGAPAKT